MPAVWWCRRSVADGRTVGYFVMSIDITEQKANQAALVQAQKMEAVGQLTGGLAHDFNNLLTIIIGNLSALQQRIGAGPGAEFVDPSLQAARRGAELIRRLLTFSRRQSLAPPRSRSARWAQHDPPARAPWARPSASICACPASRVHALVDPHQLENAILNLAINARDAMPVGGELTIGVSRRQLDEASLRWSRWRPATTCRSTSAIPAGHRASRAASACSSPSSPPGLRRRQRLGLSMVYGFVRASPAATSASSARRGAARTCASCCPRRRRP